ncbi:hypothetical protein [Methanospirillum hungatei]|uniref:hypothetical protein n=1 Tax=Methanospirillum hungatei TaxID=2203 RepID=UPI0026EEE614|nr:hypothetical protein [Methanospirillum hungatei]MCA1917129.1 hypothetical protein [Methanospirillum hungatei]
MDVKTSNIITMAAGVIFILLGINNIMQGTAWWHYITFVIGIIILALGAYGYKTGKRF